MKKNMYFSVVLLALSIICFYSSASFAGVFNAEATAKLEVISESLTAGHVIKIKRLIGTGGDVDVKNIYSATLLYMATQNNFPEIVKVLIDANADINARKVNGVTPLWKAAQTGNTEILKLLLDAGADINIASMKDNSTPIVIASAKGHAEIVELLKAHEGVKIACQSNADALKN